jgi:hypothetical protein
MHGFMKVKFINVMAGYKEVTLRNT